jgi:hypothetical protein
MPSTEQKRTERTGERRRVAGATPCSSVMSFAILYTLVRFLLDLLLVRRQSELKLQAEVLASDWRLASERFRTRRRSRIRRRRL